jgi:nickel-dependent lactate racemase
VHDPADRDRLSYLAASTDAKPIYINRAIHDADLVVTIGCLRLSESLGYHGISSSVFPAFSDAANVERYRSRKSSGAAQRERLCKDASEVTWLLGMRFTIQVVPGAGGEILHVLAGDIDAVFREGSRLCDAAWSYQVPRRAELVVATIEGPAVEQTWENVARALAAAARVAEPDAAVVVCSELAEQPGPTLVHAVGADDLDVALRALARTHTADSLVASEVIRALQRGNVYLLSRLDDESVEELGILPVAAEQVSRLAVHYASCIVLANAPNQIAHPCGERRAAPRLARPKSRP